MRFPGFIGPTYQLSSKKIDCQRCINLFLEKIESGTGKDREPFYFSGVPGKSLLAAIDVGPIRGLWRAANGTLYVVSKQTLYSVSSSWVATSLGTLSTTSGQVSMADDGFNLIIVDGTYGYDYNFSSNTFAKITDPNFQAADLVAYQDSYFIFNKTGTQIFFISDLPSSSPTAMITFTAGDVASAEGAPDNLVSLIDAHENLWLFGEVSTEVWFNSGANSFPFERIQGAFIEYGCAAKFSPAKLANTLFWLGKDDKGTGIVVMADGYVPKRISTHAIEQAIQAYTDISDAVSWTYQENGHHFYVLTFPTGGATWAFDTTTQQWHERAYLNNGVLERDRAVCHAYVYGVHVVGDYANGNIYQLSSSIKSDNGNPISRKRVSPHVSQGMNRNFYNSFELDLEVGVGLDGSGQGTNPQVILRYSNDGGNTWSSELWAGMGKIGETRWRARWTRLGQARDRVFEITITDPVKVAIVGAELDVTPGAS